MQNFSKIIAILSVVSIVLVGVLFIFDVVQMEDMRDTLWRILLALAIVALGGFCVSTLARPK